MKFVIILEKFTYPKINQNFMQVEACLSMHAPNTTCVS